MNPFHPKKLNAENILKKKRVTNGNNVTFPIHDIAKWAEFS